MKLRKVMSAGLAAVMVASMALTGCGGSGSGSSGGDGSTKGSGKKAESITVNIWDNNQQPGLQQIADEWSKTSGVKVSIEVVDWNNYWTLLEAGASGGQMPDVFWTHTNTAQMYMENDLFLNLDDYIAKDDAIDLSNYYEGIVSMYQHDGSQYALPKDHDTIALLYNQKIFDKYKLSYPDDTWTWEDVYEAAKTITEESKGEYYGFAMNTSNDQDTWYNIIYDYGGQIITDDGKDTTIDSKEAKAGMEMARKILTVSAPQAVVAETGTDSLFQSNKIGMITQGSWMVNSFYTAENGSDYKWAMIPYADVNGDGECQPEERQTCYNGLGWAISKKVEDPDSCYSLISAFCSEEGQLKQSELGVTMAAYKGASEAFSAAFEGMDLAPFVDVEEKGTLYFYPHTRNTQVWGDALRQQGAFLDAFQAPDDADAMSTACDNAAKIIRDAIAAE